MTTAEVARARIEGWLAEERAQHGLTRCDGRLDAVTDGAGRTCRYGWDDRGDLVSIAESDGPLTRYEYDPARRLSAVRRADGTITRYRYDAAGRLERIDADGVAHRYAYDGAGRVVTAHRGRAGGVVYRRDGVGRVVEYRTSEVTNGVRFDPQGRVAALWQTIDGVTIEATLRYDAAGRLQVLGLPGGALHYEWDAAGRPARVRAGHVELARFTYRDERKLTQVRLANGVLEESVADPVDRRPLRRSWSRGETTLAARAYDYDAAGRITADGARRYAYDVRGRLAEACALDTDRRWCPGAASAAETRSFDFDDIGRLVAVREAGGVLARFRYDGKGRVAAMQADGRVERYLYGPADELLAVTDGVGRPLRRYARTPLGCLAELAAGGTRFLHLDERGGSVLVTDERGDVVDRPGGDPYGLPDDPARPGPWFGGRIWNPVVRLYPFGARWYDPASRRFLSPDGCTAAPDDIRLVNPLVDGATQIQLREQLLAGWLARPAAREPLTFCADDPVNRIDANGHWSFGRVLLTLLGAIWTLPNTLFGLLVEITCLIGEVIRWLVFVVTIGNVSWATPGLDAAASDRLNAFALVFRGGWLGSFDSLLGITFGNVFFVHHDWENQPSITTGPNPVAPTAYGGAVTLPRSEALYEHELRHTNQYGWLGPFFHLGLPVFGVYEWDVILHGYAGAALERDATAHGGI